MRDFSLSYMQKWIYNGRYMVNLAVTLAKLFVIAKLTLVYIEGV